MSENKNTKEIDVLALLLKLLKEKKTMAKFVGVAAVIGLIVAVCTPRIYTAQTVLAPEMSSGGLGLSSNLADMASTFGIDLDKKSSVDAIYPELYPDVFASPDFLLGLYDVKIRTKDNDSVRTYYYHLTKENKSPFWDKPKEWIALVIAKIKAKNKGNGSGQKDPYKISELDSEICEAISACIMCVVDKKTSEITISFSDQDPLVATIMVDTLQSRLQQYITEYRTKKARIDYNYYKNLASQMRLEFERSRNKYVVFADANQNIQLQSYVQKGEEMEDDMQQKYDTYKSVLTSMRQAHAKIQEYTPAFTTIQRPVMPYKPSGRTRMQTVFIYMILGVIAGAAWVLYIKKKVKK